MAERHAEALAIARSIENALGPRITRNRVIASNPRPPKAHHQWTLSVSVRYIRWLMRWPQRWRGELILSGERSVRRQFAVTDSVLSATKALAENANLQGAPLHKLSASSCPEQGFASKAFRFTRQIRPE